MVSNELPPNSHKYKEEEAFKPKIQRVINTEVKTRRRSLSRRFSDIFFDQDAGDIKSYLFIEVHNVHSEHVLEMVPQDMLCVDGKVLLG